MHARTLLLTPILLVAGCYEQPNANGFGSTTPRYERPTQDKSGLAEAVVPVRIGELGSSFAACNAQGIVREQGAAGAIPVRAAPFQQARETGQVAPGARFFICTRSLDQSWMGIVYDQAGQTGANCGVSSPISGRRDYSGPCDSGWVASAQVRLVSGVQAPPVQVSENGAQLK